MRARMRFMYVARSPTDPAPRLAYCPQAFEPLFCTNEDTVLRPR